MLFAPSIEEQIKTMEAYNRQMDRGGLAIDEDFDLTTFDLEWHFEKCGPGVGQRLVPLLTRLLQQWAEDYQAGKKTLDLEAHQVSVFSRFAKDFLETALSKHFLDRFDNKIHLDQVFDEKRAYTISDYGVRCLLVSLYLNDRRIVEGDFASAGDKYAYMSAIRFAIYEMFGGLAVPDLKLIHLPQGKRSK